MTRLPVPPLLPLCLLPLTAGLLACDRQGGDGTETPPGSSPYPTNPQAGDWTYALSAVASNGCALPALGAGAGGGLALTVADIWSQAFTVAGQMNLDPAASDGAQVALSCTHDAVTFTCVAADAVGYAPDRTLDAVFPVRVAWEGSTGTAVSPCGSYATLDGVWTLTLEGACTGADCASVWADVSAAGSGCATSLAVTASWVEPEGGCGPTR